MHNIGRRSVRVRLLLLQSFRGAIRIKMMARGHYNKRPSQTQATKKPSAGHVTMSAPAEELSEEEWKFDTVPDHEFLACFIYEYARSSKRISEKMALWRERVPKLSDLSWAIFTHPAPLEGEGENDRKEVHDKNPFVENGDSVANYPIDPLVLSVFSEFPDTPWQRLQETEKKLWFIDQWEPDAEPFKVHQPPYNRLARAFGYHCEFDFENFTDDMILKGIQEWLSQERERLGIDEPAVQNRPLWGYARLPFSPRTALKYLGVWRRKQHFNRNWKKILKPYPLPGPNSDLTR